MQLWDLSVMSDLVNPQVLYCAGENGPVRRQLGSHFRLTSADIGLKLLQSREGESLKSSWFHSAESEMFPNELLSWKHLKMQPNTSRYI